MEKLLSTKLWLEKSTNLLTDEELNLTYQTKKFILKKKPTSVY